MVWYIGATNALKDICMEYIITKYIIDQCGWAFRDTSWFIYKR